MSNGILCTMIKSDIVYRDPDGYEYCPPCARLAGDTGYKAHTCVDVASCVACGVVVEPAWGEDDNWLDDDTSDVLY